MGKWAGVRRTHMSALLHARACFSQLWMAGVGRGRHAISQLGRAHGQSTVSRGACYGTAPPPPGPLSMRSCTSPCDTPPLFRLPTLGPTPQGECALACSEPQLTCARNHLKHNGTCLQYLTQPANRKPRFQKCMSYQLHQRYHSTESIDLSLRKRSRSQLSVC